MLQLPLETKQWRRKATLCFMIQSARLGQSFYASGDCIVCGGREHLSLGKSPITNLENFLVNEERMVGSTIAARRLLCQTRKRAPKSGNYIAFAPLEKALFEPDAVLFVCNALQASRILWLDAFRSGNIHPIFGEPLCSGVIGTPISCHRIGISLMDMACRAFGRYATEEMVVGVPYKRLTRIVNSIDKSIAGTARPIFLPKLLLKILKP